MKAIEFNNVWEKYRIKFIGGGKVSWEEFWALKDVNFKVDKGEVLGVIGCNGAGKTTLLKLISGALIPDRGEVQVTGRVSVLMELGAGFNPEFTGRENIMFNAQMYGLDKETLAQQMEKIIEFADIGKFIEAPIKYYSQGMYMRLAFALAIFVEPDILLIDDILAVGDEEAQQRCIKKIFELKQAGKTIVLVSHDMNIVNKLCNRVILLEKGKVIQKDSPAKVIPYYLETVGEKKGIAVLEKERARIVFNNGRIIFNYGTELLTKGPGGYAASFVPSINSWLSSSNLNWLAKSPLPDTIVAEGRSQDGPIAQIWTIQLKDDCLQWGLEIKEDVKEPHIDLILNPIYKRWITLDKSGDFPPFAHKSKWQDLGLNSCPESILGVSPGLEIQDLPSLILEQKDKDSSLKLFNTGYEQEGRVIQWHLNINSDNFISIKIFSKKDRFAEHIKNAKLQLLLKQQQEQARLRASRTISQGNLRLFADLETKSLRLYYKDKEITKAPGLHTSFLFKNVWYDTSSCSWQIRKKKDGFILNLLWEQPRFSSTWKFSLKDNFLFWQAGFKCLDFLDLLKFGLSLIPAYKTFFCAHQQGNFPAQFTHWQDMHLEEPEPALLGLRKVARLPAIVLDNKQHLSSLIQNSDAQTCCRILQLSYPKQSLKKKKYFSFSTKLSLLEEETPIDEYLKQEKQRLLKRQQEEEQRLRQRQQEEEQRLRQRQQEEEQRLRQRQQEEEQRLQLKQQQEQARLRASRTISQGNLRLFADLETKSLRLYYKDKEITKTDGLNSVFRVSREWFSLKSACVQWKIQKISERKTILTLYYEFISLSQIWTLICRDDNTLRIKIEIETNKPIFLTSQDVKLELQNKYENWLTAYEKGSLLVNQYIDNVGPIRLKDNKISEVILKPENESDFPQLFFGASSHLNKRIMGIYKHKEVNGERLCLNSSLIIPKKEGLINPGSRYTYFEGKIALDKDINLKEESISPRVIKLSKGNLKFAFNRGKGNIFWEDKELTRGLNIYTSVRCSGLWRDSYQATWQVNRKGNNKIVASGAWPHIPIAQKWQIEIIGKNAISWRVDMEIYEEVELDMEQANIMLSSAYKTWIIPGFNQGEFLDEYTQDYDILPFRFWHGKTEEIAATAKTLPRITFKNEMKKDNLRAIVENTDNLYQARLIQYQKTNNRNLLPGIYLYFKGMIEIEPEK